MPSTAAFRRSHLALTLGLAVAAAACSSDPTTTPSGTGGGATACSADQLAALEAQMSSKLDAASQDPSITSIPDFTLLLETNDGRTYSHSHGGSTATTTYESASTSKLVTAVVILDLVDRGALSLDTKPHDLLPFWQEDQVTLRQLLAFTSGFYVEPLCQNAPNYDFEQCVQNIYAKNAGNGVAAGSEFYYASTHLQVAGLMAMKATGAASWGAIFDAFKQRTGLFPTAKYDLPSATNPRLAGGMHWTATEYLDFLGALARGEILSDASRKELFANQRNGAKVVYSPAFGSDKTKGLGEDWAYGLGNWLECPTAKALDTYDCGEHHRNSSAGAYGAYPFIDFDHGYYGILARQGALGTGTEGVQLFRTVQDEAAAWTENDCSK